MSLAGGDHAHEPLHREFNSCAIALTLVSAEPLSGAALKAMAKELMIAVAEKTRSAGALEIGHVKAVIESGGGIIYANTVGSPHDVTVKGEPGGPSGILKLTLNSVVLGLTGLEAAQAAKKAAGIWADIYGLRIRESE